MERITKARVSAAANELIQTATRAGLFSAHDTYVLQTGSSTYGRAWRLYGVPEGQTGRHTLAFVGFGGYLGDTAREALRTLDTIRNTLHAVIDVQRAAETENKAREANLHIAYDRVVSPDPCGEPIDYSHAGLVLLDAVCDFLARNDETTGA